MLKYINSFFFNKEFGNSNSPSRVNYIWTLIRELYPTLGNIDSLLAELLSRQYVNMLTSIKAYNINITANNIKEFEIPYTVQPNDMIFVFHNGLILSQSEYSVHSSNKNKILLSDDAEPMFNGDIMTVLILKNNFE